MQFLTDHLVYAASTLSVIKLAFILCDFSSIYFLEVSYPSKDRAMSYLLEEVIIDHLFIQLFAYTSVDLWMFII